MSAQRIPHNIERSAFRRGEYVGYGNGVWLVTRSTSSYGRWCARHRDNPRAPPLTGLGEKIEDYRP